MIDDDASMLRFKSDIIKMTLRLNLIHHVNGIPSDITVIAALKLLARFMEMSGGYFEGRNIREITLGEIEDNADKMVEIGMKELDFILADHR